MLYGHKKQLKISFIEAVLRIESGLVKEGFVILCRTDIKEILKNKLNIEYNNFLIFITNNPSFTYWSLQENKQVGLLLPFNIIVYEEDNKIFTSGLLAKTIIGLENNSHLIDIAKKVEKKIIKIIDSL